MAMLGAKCSPCCENTLCTANPGTLREEADCPHKYTYQYGPVFNNVPTGEIIASRQTITIPPELSLPVLVRGCGGCDDGFAINGERLSRFNRNPRDYTATTRTITVGTWNDGGPAVCGVTLCFFEINPLP